MQCIEKCSKQILQNNSAIVQWISASKPTFTTQNCDKLLFGFASQVTRGQNIKVS